MDKADKGFVDISQFSRYPSEKEILFNCMNVFRVEGCRKTSINMKSATAVKLRYVGMVKLKESMLEEDRLEDKQLQMIKNYDYQQKHAARSKADLLFELEEWEAAIVQAKQELLRLEVQRRVEGLNWLSLRESLPLIKIIQKSNEVTKGERDDKTSYWRSEYKNVLSMCRGGEGEKEEEVTVDTHGLTSYHILKGIRDTLLEHY